MARNNGCCQARSDSVLVCCGDRRLNPLAQAIDGNNSYRCRGLGTPSNFIIDQSSLYGWFVQLVGFPENEQPIRSALILVHTGCLAVCKNQFFQTLNKKRENLAKDYPPEDTERVFCEWQIERIKEQIDVVRGTRHIPEFGYGIIDTNKVVEHGNTITFEQAINSIFWPYGIPDFLRDN